MSNPMLQIGDALINVQNVNLITLNANKSGEVIMMDGADEPPPAATISFFTNSGAYEVKFYDLDKAKAAFNKIAIRTSAQLIEGV